MAVLLELISARRPLLPRHPHPHARLPRHFKYSPVHLAAVGMVDAAKGIALRFPRFLRVRDDKAPEDATNAAQIAQMYNDQACTQSKATKSTVDDDDDW